MKESNVSLPPKKIFRKSSIWEEMKLHILPIVGTVCANILWRVLNPIIRIPRDDIYIIVEFTPIIPIAVYVCIAGYTLDKLSKEKRSIELAWANDSRADFERYRDERISKITHGVLTGLSLIIMYIIFACPLQPYTGHLNTTVASLIIMYGWAWARELDDPFNGIYKLDIKALEEKWPGVCNGYKKK